MSQFLTETPEPAATRHEISGTVVETLCSADGRWLYRCPEIYPVNARHWRGYFKDEADALTDYRDKTRVPRITRAELQSYKQHGYHGVLDGQETIMRLCPLTGATSLTTFEIVPETLACPEHLIRLYQSQLLRGTVDVIVQADSAYAAAQIALLAAAGDPDDETGERRYVLPDGKRFQLDPEDEVIGGDIWAEVIVDGLVAQTVELPTRLDLDNDQALALSILLHQAIATCPDERVASLYNSMMPMLPDPPEEASAVSWLSGKRPMPAP